MGYTPGAKHLSWSSIRYVHATLRVAFHDAVKKRLLPYNPCDAITLPAKNRFEAKILTKDEMQILIDGCASSTVGLEVMLMLLLGLRRGEALGLRFGDIDFTNRTAHIRQQYTTCGKDAAGKQIWGLRSLKTKESDRTVGVPTPVLDRIVERQKIVEERKAQQAEHYHDLDLICCNCNGTPRIPNTIERGVKLLLKRSGLADMRLHDLRHTYATRLLGLSVDLKTISQMLGHTSIKTTADIYIAPSDEAAFRAAKAIESLLEVPIPPKMKESGISNSISAVSRS